MCGSSTILVSLIKIIFQWNDHSYIFTAEIPESSPEKAQELLVIIIVPIVVFIIIVVPVLTIAIRISATKCCKKKGRNNKFFIKMYNYVIPKVRSEK